MQPPPRKGKVTSALRNIHSEQLVKLQAKHQQDADFLDDIRNFTKMRAVIEKEYAQSLLKLATTYLQKKNPTVPEIKSDGGDSYKTVYGVWKTMLDENEKIAKARLAATEVYQQQVSESSKSLRLFKMQVAKKCFDNMRKMHEEIQTCVVEIDKTKKLYFEEEHMAHDAREKAHDADERLKRKKGRIFQSVSSLQKNSAKFSFRREACDIQATKARNDYVLALLAANAHQSKYYESDLPELVQFIDCDIYDKVREYILLISRTELLTCAACQSSFNVVQEQANTATKQYTMECFFKDNPILSQPILYEFEPCDNDKINTLSIEHNAALCLSKEARRWASCVAKEVRVIRDSKEELRKLLGQIGDKSLTLSNETQGPLAEAEARVDELRQIIRRAQTSKRKAESRLEAMIEAGVNVEDWVRTSETESISISDSPADNLSRSGTVTSRASRRSYHTEAFEGSTETNDAFYDSDSAPEAGNASLDTGNEVPYLPDLTSAVDVVAAVQEAWDAAAETEEFEPEPEPVQVTMPPEEVVAAQVNGEVPAAAPGQRCVALFSYEATNSDELSFVEQEELELINEGDGDGWVKARNYRGEEGYIPQNYVEISETQATGASSRPPLTSFSSVDYTMPNEDLEVAQVTAAAEVPVVNGTATFQEQRPSDLSYERISCCQALYDYEATCDEELTFFEGQIIRILKKVVFDVDDGWWEGEIDGKVGLFPSLVVEELKENGEPLTPMSPPDTPLTAPPPAFTPPEAQLIIPPAQVTLTRPTPEVENPEDGEVEAVMIGMEKQDDFCVELPKKQQVQYREQFSTSDTESSEHEASVAEKAGKYARLKSSPESPTQTAATDSKKEDCVIVNGIEDKQIEDKQPVQSQASDDCPTVVVTAVTGGDTPTSDDDLECKPPEETAAEPSKQETEPADETYPNPDKFECNFEEMGETASEEKEKAQDDSSNFAPKTAVAINANENSNVRVEESDKMDVNGAGESNKDFFDNSSQNFRNETTG